MERLGDDVLGLILRWVDKPIDRISFSVVCKQWLRVEGLTRSSLRVFESYLLPSFLPRFPNLLTFESSKPISNGDIEFLAQTCPKLEVLYLNYKEDRHIFDESGDEISDYGVSVVAAKCSNLTRAFLRRRLLIGNAGVVSLVDSLRNLTILDLGRCSMITDKALEAIGAANSLEVLNLQGCWLITDVGLASLASGSSSRTLKQLVIAECDQITDMGLLHLKQMGRLEELNLADCGPKVTDNGGMAIAAIQTLKCLKLSWLINISDATLVALARNCQNLVALDLTGCELITGAGIRAFATHGSLEELVLVHCDNFTADDLEYTVVGCETLGYIGLDKRLRMWIPSTIQQNVSKFCRLDWK